MLEVGITISDPENPGGSVGLTHNESRLHFAMWAVTSSPLVIGFDLTDDEKVMSVWDIVANQEVLEVSATWAGHPGRLVRNSTNYYVSGKQFAQLSSQFSCSVVGGRQDFLCIGCCA
jgi:hypothetical protein